MRIAHVAAEVSPWCSSGGLGQVMAALPDAIASEGAAVDAYFPLCRRARTELELEHVADLGDGIALVTGPPTGASRLFFIDAPHAFDRPSLYGEHGAPYSDDRERFSEFTDAVTRSWELTGEPDVVHSHDWHAALLPHQATEPSVLTIHNLAYQGRFDEAPVAEQRNFMRTGIESADVVATVSPTYATEILVEGFGLEGVLASRAPIAGILNGIDTAEWDPATDRHIPEPFSADDLSGKAAARAEVVGQFGLGGDRILIGVVSRLVEQKGIDLIAEVAEHVDADIVVVGTGDPDLVDQLRRSPVALWEGWDPALAHLVNAGADAAAIPSRFEPCGLTQMQAMRYGTVPIAHAVGGLADTVIDPGDSELADGNGSGITFDRPDAEALAGAIARAAELHRHGWQPLQRAIMAIDWSWNRAAATYLELYRGLSGGS